MCFSSPKIPDQKIAGPPPTPELPPEPPITATAAANKTKRAGRSSLRIDLAAGAAGNTSLGGKSGSVIT